MSLQNFIIPLSGTWIILKLFITVIEFSGVRLFELRDIRRQANWQKHPFSKTLRQRPLISIVVYAHNQESHITACLQNIAESKYRKVEVLVVDDASKDQTKKLVKIYSNNNPGQKITLYAKRKYCGKLQAVREASKHKAKGEILLVIDAVHRLNETTLQNLVRYAATYPKACIVPATQYAFRPSVVGLAQQYEDALIHYKQKYFTTVNDINVRTRQSSKVNEGTIYAPDVVIYHAAGASYRRLLQSWLHDSLSRSGTAAARSINTAILRKLLLIIREFILVVEPIFITYFTVVAISYSRPALFFVSLAIILAPLGFAIGTHETFSFGQKLQQSFFLPFAAVILVCRATVQAVALCYRYTKYRTNAFRRSIRTAKVLIQRLVTKPA